MAWWDRWVDTAKKAIKKVVDRVKDIVDSVKKKVVEKVEKVKETIRKTKEAVRETVKEKIKKVRKRTEETEKRVKETVTKKVRSLDEGEIRAIKDAEKEGLITPAVANAYFERDMRGEITDDDIGTIDELMDRLIEIEREKPSWKETLMNWIKKVFTSKLPLLGPPSFIDIEKIYELIIGRKLTIEESVKFKLKVVDWILPLNALSKLFFGKNLDGKAEEFGIARDYIDLAAAVAMFVPVGKLGKVGAKLTSKVGYRGFTKLFAASSDDAIKMFARMTRDEQVKILKGLGKTDAGLSIVSRLMKAKVVKDIAYGVTPALFLKKPAQVTKWFNKLASVDQIALIAKWEKMMGGKTAISIMLRNATKIQSTGWLMKNIKWIGAAIVIMSQVSFIEFLYEETLQVMGFGMWPLISNKMWKEADEYYYRAMPMIDKAEWFYKYVGWMAPYSWDVFRSYARATRMQYDSYRKVIDKKLGTFENPSINGKVFDKSAFRSNLLKGTAPNVTDLVVPIIEELPEEEVPPVEKPEVVVPEEELAPEEIVDVVDILEIPEPYTPDQEWALTEAFKMVLALTEGRAVMSREERENLFIVFEMYTDEQKKVLDLLKRDVIYYTKSREQLSTDEFNDLKIKYRIEV